MVTVATKPDILLTRDQFHYRDFNKSIAKFVRKDHAVGSYWKPRDIIQNKMAG